VPEGFDGWLGLQLLGYPMRDPQAALRAFRLHYRGVDDANSPIGDADLRVLHALLKAELEVGQEQKKRAAQGGPSESR
jgi:N-acetylmuramoyl-L-alanine amidase